MTAERIVAFKIIGGIAGLVVGLLVAPMLPFEGIVPTVAIAVLFGLTGYTFPSAGLASKASKRQKAIRKALPDTMDLLTISVEAGLGFDAALAQVVKNVPGPLSEEIARMLQEMQIGVSRSEALRHVNDRTEVPELDGFVLSMIQADKYGVGVAKVLGAVYGASTEAPSASGGSGPEGAAEAPVPHDLHGPACPVHRDPGARRHQGLRDLLRDVGGPEPIEPVAAENRRRLALATAIEGLTAD